MFGFKKKKENPRKVEFDPARQKAILRCSICNGEQVAGFKNIETGQFTEVGVIRGNQELEEFKKTYGIVEITKEY